MTGKRPRDTQRKKFWKAHGRFMAEVETKKFGTLEECQKFVDWVLKKAKVTTEVVCEPPAQRRSNASWNKGVIKIPKLGKHEGMVLYLTAHAIHAASPTYNTEAYNGRELAAAYVMLADAIYSREQRKLLRELFKEEGVKYKPKRVVSKPPQKGVTPEGLERHRTMVNNLKLLGLPIPKKEAKSHEDDN